MTKLMDQFSYRFDPHRAKADSWVSPVMDALSSAWNSVDHAAGHKKQVALLIKSSINSSFSFLGQIARFDPATLDIATPGTPESSTISRPFCMVGISSCLHH